MASGPFVPPMPRQGIEGARSMPVKVSVLCSPNALAGHWGNKGPLGFYPCQRVGTLCSPNALAEHWGYKGPFGFACPMPGRALGKHRAPWVPSILRLCFPNTLAEHWVNKGPLGLYFAGSSPQISWYQLVCVRVTQSP